MTDIVEHLRDLAGWYRTGETEEVVMRGAADEIERLRGGHDRIIDAFRRERDTLRAEIERLRQPYIDAGMRVMQIGERSWWVLKIAAEEIERLRAENSALNEILDREGLQRENDWESRFRRNSPDPSYSSRR